MSIASKQASTPAPIDSRSLTPTHSIQARASEGCSFLTDCRDEWEDKDGPLQQHMAWHLGLFSLERGQESRATRVFDTLLAPPRVSEV